MKELINRLYNDLAWVWPLWGEVQDYKMHSDLIVRLIKKNTSLKVKTMLDMGCGGGKNDFHFKRYFIVTGVDISKAMLANARRINPDCEYIQGDIRNVQLDRQFDSIFINDSVAYMRTKNDLMKLFSTTYQHLRPGGVMIVVAESWKESFYLDQNELLNLRKKKTDILIPYDSQNHSRISTIKAHNLEITIIENSYDKNKNDDKFEATIIFLIRRNGKLKIEVDTHILGLYTLDFWERTLNKVGFRVKMVSEYAVSSKYILKNNLPIFICTK